MKKNEIKNKDFNDRIKKIQEEAKKGGFVFYQINYERRTYVIDVFDYESFNRKIEDYVSKEKLDNYSNPNDGVRLIIRMRRPDGRYYYSYILGNFNILFEDTNLEYNFNYFFRTKDQKAPEEIRSLIIEEISNHEVLEMDEDEYKNHPNPHKYINNGENIYLQAIVVLRRGQRISKKKLEWAKIHCPKLYNILVFYPQITYRCTSKEEWAKTEEKLIDMLRGRIIR